MFPLSQCWRVEPQLSNREVPMSIRSAEPSETASSLPASGLDGLVAKWYDELLLVARVALGAIFVLSGYLKLTGLQAFSASLTARGVPAAWLWGPVGATVEFVGGVLILLGLGTRYAALLMILFVIVATAISHRFWEFADPQQFRTQQSQFFKNLSIIGGFLFVLAAGGGRYAVDAMWRRRRA
jgi:putative oxidoreductase